MVSSDLANAPGGLLFAVVGPTASGKSALAMALASQLGLEIIGCDSVQVYRGFDIGSAKPTQEEQQRVPHHLIDVVEPHEAFNAGIYAVTADAAIAAVRQRERWPVLVGGTGLYLRALIHGLTDVGEVSEEVQSRLQEELNSAGLPHLYTRLQKVDPELGAQLPAGDTQRILRGLAVFESTGVKLSELQAKHRFAAQRYETCILALDVPRELLYERINQRVIEMMETGFVDEVRSLLESGVSLDSRPMAAPGYREIAAMLRGEISESEVIERTQRSHRRYAKTRPPDMKAMDRRQ